MLDNEPQAQALAAGLRVGPGVDLGVTDDPAPQSSQRSRSSEAMGTRYLLVLVLILLVLGCGECVWQGTDEGSVRGMR